MKINIAMTCGLIVGSVAAALAFGQTSVTHNNIGSRAALTAVYPYLLVYTTTEKCPECGFRYAMYCPGSDCNVPTKEVKHFKEFGSKQDALDFLNNGFVGKFTRLLRVVEVPVKQSTQTAEVPQPALVVETNRFSLDAGGGR